MDRIIVRSGPTRLGLHWKSSATLVIEANGLVTWQFSDSIHRPLDPIYNITFRDRISSMAKHYIPITKHVSD